MCLAQGFPLNLKKPYEGLSKRFHIHCIMDQTRPSSEWRQPVPGNVLAPHF